MKMVKEKKHSDLLMPLEALTRLVGKKVNVRYEGNNTIEDCILRSFDKDNLLLEDSDGFFILNGWWRVFGKTGDVNGN